MLMLFGKPPKMANTVQSRKLTLPAFDGTLVSYVPEIAENYILAEAVRRVLSLPSVGSKSFLITIGDRSVGGATVRDQMVGPWQVPVADVAVTALSLQAKMRAGIAYAMGEKPTLSFKSPAASARMAVAESLMNLAAADIADGLERVKLSANWMTAINHPGEGAALYEAVEAIGMELGPQLGLSIPVGKDSMSMKMRGCDEKGTEVTAPLSLVITAFTATRNITRTWTPTLRRVEDVGETLLLLVDLSEGFKALGGSALAQCFGQIGDEVPDIRDVDLFKDYFDAIEQLHQAGIVLAYHDRSDGGLFTTLVEMMFAGRCGLDVMLDHVSSSHKNQHVIPALFNEELGAVFQVRKRDEIAFNRCFATCGPPPGLIKRIGRVSPAKTQAINIWHGAEKVYSESRATLQQLWSSTSYQMQRLRDDAACADAEFANILDDSDPGLSYRLNFDLKDDLLPWRSSLLSTLNITNKPRVAILREQGTNGHAEMAFAFTVAGFSAHDVHMTDIISGRVSLAGFAGMAAAGGFSYGDVLGAGRGWAQTVLQHAHVRTEFKAFFERPDTFTLGVCNGCQFLSHLQDIIPGARGWPMFKNNASEQYEARLCMVEISDEPAKAGSPSVFLNGKHSNEVLHSRLIPCIGQMLTFPRSRDAQNPPPHCRRPRRGPRRLPHLADEHVDVRRRRRVVRRGRVSRAGARAERSCPDPVHDEPPRPDRGVPLQSQRLAAGHRGCALRRRARARDDAAPGAHGAGRRGELPVAADAGGRGQGRGGVWSVGQDVQEREEVGWVRCSGGEGLSAGTAVHCFMSCQSGSAIPSLTCTTLISCEKEIATVNGIQW